MVKFRGAGFLLAAVMLSSSCTGGEPVGRPTRAQLPRSPAFYERMVFLMMSDTRARLRGFDGAVPPGTVVALLNLEDVSVATATADADGRFEMEADAFPEQVFVVRPGMANVAPMEFSARRRDDALRQAVVPRVAGTGSTPNHVTLAVDAPFEGDVPAYVVLSGDNAVDNVALETGNRVNPFVPLEEVPGPQGNLAASPWRAHVDAGRAYVTRYGQGTMSVLDTARGTILATTAPLALQVLAAPITLDPPADADLDGIEESVATQLRPRNPTDVLVRDGVAYVAFANVLTTTASGRSQFGPGMLAAFDLRADGTPDGNVRVTTLSFQNPQAVLAHPDGLHVVVSSTGTLHRGATWAAESDGGLDLVSTRDFRVVNTVNMGRFAPSRPVLAPGGDAFFVPSLLQARLARVNVATFAVTHGPGGQEGALQLLPTEDLRSVFECAAHPAGVLLCAVFDEDALVVVDPRKMEVNPWPFTEPWVIPGQGSRQGLQSLAVRGGRHGVDRVGVDVVLLMGLASRVSALDSRWVFGP